MQAVLAGNGYNRLARQELQHLVVPNSCEFVLSLAVNHLTVPMRVTFKQQKKVLIKTGCKLGAL